MPSFDGQQRPCDRQVTGRIADAARPTVAFDENLLTLATTQTTIRLRPTGPAAPGTAPGSGQPPIVPRTA